jgi:hypothetical protein
MLGSNLLDQARRVRWTSVERPRDGEDYWRIYAAEACANGLFFAFFFAFSFAFFLADTVGDPTATELGLMPLYQSLTATPAVR